MQNVFLTTKICLSQVKRLGQLQMPIRRQVAVVLPWVQTKRGLQLRNSLQKPSLLLILQQQLALDLNQEQANLVYPNQPSIFISIWMALRILKSLLSITPSMSLFPKPRSSKKTWVTSSPCLRRSSSSWTNWLNAKRSSPSSIRQN